VFFFWLFSVEEVDFTAQRGPDKNQFLRLAEGDFLQKRENLLITGATTCAAYSLRDGWQQADERLKKKRDSLPPSSCSIPYSPNLYCCLTTTNGSFPMTPYNQKAASLLLRRPLCVQGDGRHG
jgi:hypothetical protein